MHDAWPNDFGFGQRFPAMRSLVAGGGPAILLPAVALLIGSGILTYAMLRRT